MLTSFGKTLRKLRIDHAERLLDMAKKLDISVAFLSSVEIGKKSVPVGMEEKIIELYDLDQDMASRLRQEADACRKSFTIKSSNSSTGELVGMFARVIDNISPEDVEKMKKLMKQIKEKKGK
ncbi:XRE family transcriptional regulator [Bartonella sp. CL71SXKL]|uniref:XRE family transcriptional regulator n=1 Tax=Bartonella sp. CL71SXKL TaxID=3243540 RepID=UPI0035CEE34B